MLIHKTFSGLAHALMLGALFLALRPAVALADNPAPKRIDYVWRNVPIGGGGYVTGIVAHPTVPNLLYIRTDVGGAYRFSATPDNQGRNWIPVLDGFGVQNHNLFGVESIAVDPADPNIVYMAAGRFRWAGKGQLLKSSDRGKTWKFTSLQIAMEGNGPYKVAGERLAVDPVDHAVVYFGSRDDGLLMSESGGNRWSKVQTIPEPTHEAGVTFVLPDPTRRARNRRDRAPLYAAVAGQGIMLSEDGTKSWQNIGGPKIALRGALASDGSLYVTGPSGIMRYNEGTWEDITPEPGAGYCAIAVDPRRPDIIIAARLEAKVEVPLYLSINRGKSWKTLTTTNGNISAKPDVQWWGNFAGAPAALLIDPLVKNRLWLTDWVGTWVSSDYRATPILFRTYERGHEELVINSLTTPSVGAPVFSAVADGKGFRHDQLYVFPTKTFDSAGVWSSFGIDHFPGNPDKLIRVGVRGDYGPNSEGGVAISNDNGKSWSATKWDPKLFPVKVAYSATKENSFVVLPVGGVPLYSTDLGVSWQESTGATPGAVPSLWDPRHPLAADRLKGNLFYLYNDGTFFRSNDGGQTWAAKASLPKASRVYVEASPDRTGWVWVSLDGQGLYMSTDGGDSFTKIETVSTSMLFGLGRHAPHSENPMLYVYGALAKSKELRLYASRDLGEHWSDIFDPAQKMGNDPTILRGDMQTFGRVYVGTGGRGLFYGQPR